LPDPINADAYIVKTAVGKQPVMPDRDRQAVGKRLLFIMAI
jgi:hypothetical protein